MPRAADYTIKGFLYQFNKSILEILKSSDESTITVEGIVEDVEVATPSLTRAIQCKYHEAGGPFAPSSIFRPLLQMMHHFHSNADANIHYILFAHFQSVDTNAAGSIGRPDLEDALNSKNVDLQKLTEQLRGKVDLEGFLTRFTLEFGPAFNELVTEVCGALKANGIPEGDIDTLAYPNAIYIVARLSVKHDPAERSTTKPKFLKELKEIRKTAISRWTLALRTRKQLLEARRAQLKTHLDKNARLRHLVIDSKSLDDYSAEIVLFVRDYLDKYHFKPAHIYTPVFCLCTSLDDLNDVEYRLYEKGIICATGLIGGRFEAPHLFREPLYGKEVGGLLKREFSIRLLRWEDHGPELNVQKCEDLYIIGEPDCDSLDTGDVNVERLAASSLKEIKYLMGVSNVYE
jgi:hypothetical protein